MELVTLAAVLLTVMAIPNHSPLKEWNQYKKSFNKSYPTKEEDDRRLNIFMKNKREVDEHNEKYERRESSYKKKINDFSDWLPEEIDSLLRFRIPDVEKKLRRGRLFEPPPGLDLPDYVNWVEQGAVTSVKNQERCGCCYAFSAAGALEGLLYIKNQVLQDLSTQNLVDCSEKYGNEGCNGGWPNMCFDYVKDKGINSDESYPYEAKRGTCRFDSAEVTATCKGYEDVLTDSEYALKAAVALRPVSIAFDASHIANYGSGIFEINSTLCSFVNHAMLLVGYGTDEETRKDYWLIKNSWGEGWGENGYMKSLRNANNMCQIASYASYPVLD